MSPQRIVQMAPDGPWVQHVSHVWCSCHRSAVFSLKNCTCSHLYHWWCLLCPAICKNPRESWDMSECFPTAAQVGVAMIETARILLASVTWYSWHINGELSWTYPMFKAVLMNQNAASERNHFGNMKSIQYPLEFRGEFGPAFCSKDAAGTQGAFTTNYCLAIVFSTLQFAIIIMLGHDYHLLCA